MFSNVKWFVDGGHGWLRVPIISAEGLRFSEFSYIEAREGWLYLEEDCDAGVWLRAHGLSGSAFGVVDFPGHCFVRDLPRVAVGVKS